MAGEPTMTKTEEPAPDPFAAAFAEATKPEPTPEQKAAAVAAPAAAAGAAAAVAEATGAATGEAATIDTSDVEEERPVAPTHKADGSAFTAEEIAAEQAKLDSEFEAAKTAKAADAKKKEETPPAPVTDDDIVKRLGALLGKQPAPAEPAATQQRQPEPTPQVVSQEEAQFLTQFEKDWPDAHRASQIMLKSAMHAMTNHIFGEVLKRYDPMLEQLGQVTTTQAQSELHRAIPDYDAVRDKVVAWVETQPKIHKTIYDRIVEEGTVDEIKELVDLWRVASGTPAPAARAAAPAAAAPTPAAAAATAAAATAKKAVVQALAPVTTKRTNPTSAPSKEDFDGSFAQFANETI